MAEVRVKCPKCGHRWSFTAASEGDSRTRCPECQKPLRLRGTVAEPAVLSKTVINPESTDDDQPGTSLDHSPGKTAWSDQESASSAVDKTVTFGDSGGPKPESNRVRPKLPEVPGHELLEVLGRGGMGVVYKARHQKLGRLVALKMILAAEHSGEAEQARFLTEARAVASLQHPNIVQIHEIGEHDGRPFFSLEYVDGGSLDGRLSGTPLSSNEAAALLETLSRAMDAAHSQGVIHRDLKPGNVLLSRDGTAKIADFGLAKQLDQDSRQTRTGDIVGTPSYMAPEQAAARTADIGPATDVYALGAILYEALTGRPPFRTDNIAKTLRQVVEKEPISPRQLNPDVPKDLDTVCLKCLQKDPRKRYTTAGDLAEDLRRHLAGEPVRARPIGRIERFSRWCRRNPLVAGSAGLVAVAMIVVICVLWISNVQIGDAYQTAESKRLEAVAAEKKEAKARQAETAAKVAAQKERAEKQKQYVQLALRNGIRQWEDDDPFAAALWFVRAIERDDQNSPQIELNRVRAATSLLQAPRLKRVFKLEHPVKSIQLSSDGRRLLVVKRYAQTTINLAGFSVFDLKSGKDITPQLNLGNSLFAVALSPDGRWLAVGRALLDGSGRAEVWDVDTGQRVSPAVLSSVPVDRVAFGPQGKCLVLSTPTYTRGSKDETPRRSSDIQIVDARSSRPLTATVRMPGHADAAFSPDGRLLAIAGEDTRVIDLTTGEVIAGPKKLREEAGPSAFKTGPDTYGPVFSQDGEFLLLSLRPGIAGRATRGLIVEPKTLKVISQIAFMVNFGDYTISPDGKRLAIAVDNRCHIWDVENQQQVSVIHHNSGVKKVVFSPDSQQVATGTTQGTVHLWDLLGDPQTPPLRHGAQVRSVLFNRDGDTLMTSSYDGTVRIWDLKSEAFLAPRIHQGRIITAVAFSPDGRVVATVGQHGNLRISDAATGTAICQPVETGAKVGFVAFSADGKTIFTHAHPEPGDRNYSTWDARSGRATTVVKIPPMGSLFSRDGRYLITRTPIAQVKQGQPHLQVRDADTGQIVSSIRAPESQIVFGTFSPDGKLIATGNINGILGIWETKTGKRIAALKHDFWSLRTIAFSPDGRFLISTSRGGSATLWDTTNWKPRFSPFLHRGNIISVRFSPDSRFVATASADKTARIWSTEDGMPVTPPLVHPSVVSCAAFSPNGTRFLTGCTDGYARIWNLAPDRRPVHELQRQTAALAGAKIDAFESIAPVAADELLAGWKSLVARDGIDRRDHVHDLSEWHDQRANSYALRTREQRSGDDPARLLAIATDHRNRAIAVRNGKKQQNKTPAIDKSVPLQTRVNRGVALIKELKWDEALVEFDALIAAGVDDPKVWNVRGQIHANLANWPQAIADFETAVKKNYPNPYQTQRKIAIIKLFRGDVAGYKKLCQQMLDTYGDSNDATAAAIVARTCVLGPGAVDDQEKVHALAKRALQQVKSTVTESAVAAALHRRGQHLQGGKLLQQSISKMKTVDTRIDLLLLALCSHGAGQTEAAYKNRGTALRIRLAPRGSQPGWDRLLEYQILLDETEKLFPPRPAGRPSKT